METSQKLWLLGSQPVGGQGYRHKVEIMSVQMYGLKARGLDKGIQEGGTCSKLLDTPFKQAVDDAELRGE